MLLRAASAVMGQCRYLEVLPSEAGVQDLHMLGRQGNAHMPHLHQRQGLLAEGPPVCFSLLHAPHNPSQA